MQKNLTQLLSHILLLLVLFPAFLFEGNASNPNRPFPQHTQYTSGTIKPNNVTQTQLDDSTRTFYERWKTRYLKNDCGPDQYYVFDDEKSPIICVSEGQGYGMLITAFMAGYGSNAKTYFDGLYNFYKAHPSYINNRLMAWQQITGCISEPLNGLDAATDGDLDIAYGLLLADSQWGSDGAINYLQEALYIIEAILLDEINHEIWSVKLGDWAKPAEPAYYYGTRTSDFMMDHFRVFKQIAGDTNWTKIIEKCYFLINTIQTNFSPVTGLLPDFIVDCNTTPKPAQANYLEASTDGSYSYNACRTPWRIATDYLITGDTRAKAALDKINTWIKSVTSGDPSKIRSGYRLNGSNILGTDYSAESFTCPFAVSAMVNQANQQWLNDLWTFNLSYNFDSAYYYENTLKFLSMIVISGNWWMPLLPPNAPILLQPTDRSIMEPKTITLQWNQAIRTDTYHLELSDDSLFSNKIINDSLITDTIFVYRFLASGKTYFWHVQAKNIVGASDWSPIWRFDYINNTHWGIISVCRQVVDSRKDVLFPTTFSSAFAYISGSYFSKETLSVGNGYWLKFGLTDSVNMIGDSILADSIEIAEGWNLIGSITTPVAVQDVASIPPAITTSDFFGYNKSYFITDTIQPGRGYWLKVNQDGQLILSSIGKLYGANRIKIVPSSEMPPPAPDEDMTASIEVPKEYALDQAFPNPFNPATTIKYSLPADSRVTLKAYNVLGQIVAILSEEVQSAGYKSTVWNAGSNASGMYFCRLEAMSVSDPSKTFTQVKKMLLLK